MMRRGKLGAAVGLALALAGCAPALTASPPGPGVPRIANLELTPSRVTAGCPVTIRFEVEDVDADVTGVVAHWWWRRWRTVGSGSSPLAVVPGALAGLARGVMMTHVTPARHGRYWYHVQVVDAAGRRSNVLGGVLVVDAPRPAEGPVRCD